MRHRHTTQLSKNSNKHTSHESDKDFFIIDENISDRDAYKINFVVQTVYSNITRYYFKLPEKYKIILLN